MGEGQNRHSIGSLLTSWPTLLVQDISLFENSKISTSAQLLRIREYDILEGKIYRLRFSG